MQRATFSILWNKATLLIVILVFLLVQSQFYRLKPKKEIPNAVKKRLTLLGERALQSGDVPVAALILYHDSIIGEGYNTVQRDSALGHHAEIMALNEVFKRHGNTFGHLDRGELVVYSTFEPCEMCKGAMLHYGISQVYFEENKPAYEQMKSTLKGLLYNLKSQRLDASGLQEALFKEHPGYPGK